MSYQKIACPGYCPLLGPLGTLCSQGAARAMVRPAASASSVFAIASNGLGTRALAGTGGLGSIAGFLQ